jgi:Tol biopolymer transport system component
MRLRIRFAVLINLAFVLLLSWAGLAQFVPFFDPAFRWKTIEGPHFNVTYHQGLEGVAQEALQLAEECYELILKEFKKAPQGKVEIIIYDQVDFTNGSASPFPRNTIQLLTVSARIADNFNVRLDSWWRAVIYHELLHIMDLDQVAGVNAILRKIFGRIVVPNIAKPISFIEGLAVYEKWKQLGESRLNDARTEMYLRTFVYENRIPNFGDMTVRSQSRDRWPSGGLLVYNIASWFLRYIEETYGPETMQKINDVNSAQLLNVFTLFVGLGANFSKVLRAATGKSAEELMQGYRLWLREHFVEQIEKIKAEGVTEAYRLTPHGWSTNQPAWSGDGQWIAYRSSTPGRAGIRLMDAQGQRDQEILTDLGLTQLPAWHPREEKVIYIKIDIAQGVYILNDIYEYDLKAKKERQLTHGERAFVATYSPDGSKIYYAKYIGRDGSTAISVLDLATLRSKTLKEFPHNEILVHSLEVAPDGQQLALSAYHRGGYQDIYLMPAAGDELAPVTQDKAIDINPTWSPDGSYILFSSDRGGVFNLYAYNVSEESFSRVTNVITAGLDPDVSPDGQEIVFTGYTGEGYDVFKMRYDPAGWKRVDFSQETIPAWAGYPKTEYPIRDYSPLRTLLPTAWLPIGDEKSVGLFTLGWDLLAQHTYALTAGYDFKHRQPFYSLDYNNTRLPLAITLSLGQSATRQHQGVTVTVPLMMRLATQQQASVGYRRDWQMPEPDKQNNNTEMDAVLEQSVTWSASYEYASVRGEEFFRDTLNVRISGELKQVMGRAQPERKLTVNWREYLRIPTPEGHQLAFQMSVGWSDIATESEKAAFKLGGSSGPFLLRGFPRNTIQGKLAIASSIEYRFRLLDINRTVGYWPVFIDDLTARAFVDKGMAGDVLDLAQIKLGFGAELRLTTVVGYFSSLAFRVGLGQGLGEKSPVFYFDIGSAF